MKTFNENVQCDIIIIIMFLDKHWEMEGNSCIMQHKFKTISFI